ncbi:MAG: hypothetical protein ABUS56_08805 [Acidobacteriota bacterium]
MKSGSFAVMTCLVAMATLCAFVLPKEDGRDTFVRLTRTGLHRHWSPRASSSDADEVVARVDPPSAPPGDLTATGARDRAGVESAPAILPDPPRVIPPADDLGGVVSTLPSFDAVSDSSPLFDRGPPSF